MEAYINFIASINDIVLVCKCRKIAVMVNATASSGQMLKHPILVAENWEIGGENGSITRQMG